MLEGNTKMDESQKYMEDLQKLVDTGEANEDTYDEIWDIEDSAIKRRQKRRLGREPPDAMRLFLQTLSSQIH